MNQQIQEYSQTEAALAVLSQRYGAAAFDVTTTAGMRSAKEARAELRGYRTALEAKRKEIKAPALERCRAIDEEAKRITADLLRLEEPIDATIKAEEARKEAERQAKAREEAERAAQAREAVDAISYQPLVLVGHPSDEVSEALRAITALDVSAYALAEEAATAKSAVIEKLSAMLENALEQEESKRKIAAERAELERLRSEQDARERIEREAREAADREARAKIEAEQRAARERIAEEERHASAARHAADEAARKVRDEENARLQAERERIEAERAKVEAAAREARRVQYEQEEAKAMLNSFVERFGHLTEFQGIAKTIKSFLWEVTNVAA